MGIVAEDTRMRSDLRAHVLSRARRPSLVPRRRRIVVFAAGLFTAVAAPAIVTALEPSLVSVTDGEPLEPAGLLYVLGVAAATYVGGLWAGLLAAVLSMIGQAYAYVAPRGALELVTARDVIVLGIFLFVALAFAQVLSRQRGARREAQVARERMEFLAEATGVLTRTRLDFQRTMSELAQLAIPAIADLCVVRVVDDDGLIHPIVVANSQKVDGALAENMLHLDPVPPGGERGVPGVIATGRPQLFPTLNDQVLEEIAWNEQQLVLLRGLKLGSIMIVPLQTRDGPVGALTLGFVGGRRRYSIEDLRLAEDLARRAGAALENVLLYEHRSRTARMLQQSLLPDEVPTVPGLEIVTRFHPVGESDLVGGDFYDVFETQPGTWAVVVGDVCGKGMEAAALTGLARHTIRAAALERSQPSEVLRMLNDAILRAHTDRYCTVLFALVRPGDPMELTIAAGGHPLPVLRRADGSTELLGVTGTLLGVFENPGLIDVTVGLDAGDSVLLYTDGLLDERRPDPERHLREVMEGGSAISAEAIAAEIERVVRPTDEQDDDAAMIVLRVADAELRVVPSDTRARSTG